MKKIILFIIILSSIGCTRKEELIMEQEYDNNYIETIPDMAEDYINNLLDNKTILSLKEIDKYNKEIESKNEYLYDLDIKTLNKEEIINYINMYTIPTLPKYNEGKEITAEEVKSTLENRNIDKIPKEVKLKKGLVVKRANLRSFPTEIGFYDNINSSNFDRIQETEVTVNSPVLVIHSSKDNKYFLVMTKTYVGWIKEEDIVLVSDEDYDYFVNSQNFAVITDAYMNVNDTILDMGVKLPYNRTRENGYELVIPIKDKDGNLLKKRITVSKDKAHIGYLPYTKKNLYIESFKYEDVPYSWGGKDSGVDCSSFVSNVYKTFGFVFPRNTSSQNNSVGKIISLEDKTNNEKLKIMEEYPGNLLYEDGHVLIYLGMKNNKHYVINASGSILKVVEEELDTSHHLDKIKKLVLVS